MFDTLKHAYYIAKKDLKEYYLKPGTVSWGILFPITFTLAFLFKRGEYSVWAAPGLISLTIFFSATSMAATSIVFERRIRSFERLLLFPTGYVSIALGKSLGGLMFSLITSSSTIIIVYVLLHTLPSNPSLFTLSILLAICQSSSFGVLLSFAVKDPSQTMTVFNVVRFPMIFLSGVIIPVDQLPASLSMIPYILPLTYITELIRYSYIGEYSLIPPLTACIAVIVQSITFLITTSILIRKSIP